MQFQNAAIALLAGMIFVLAGLVGWLYWQQTRTHQSLNTLAMVLAEMAQPPYEPPPPASEEPVSDEPVHDDDRADIVDDKPMPVAEVVSGPPSIDTDDLDGKTRKELQDLLTKKGIPFGKTDSKTILLQLLKASS